MRNVSFVEPFETFKVVGGHTWTLQPLVATMVFYNADVMGLVKPYMAAHDGLAMLCVINQACVRAYSDLERKDTTSYVLQFLSNEDVGVLSQYSVQMLLACNMHSKISVLGLGGRLIMTVILSRQRNILYAKRLLGRRLGLHRFQIRLCLLGSRSAVYNLDILTFLHRGGSCITLVMIQVNAECLYCGGFRVHGSLSLCGRCCQVAYCSTWCTIMDHSRHRSECRVWTVFETPFKGLMGLCCYDRGGLTASRSFLFET